MEITNFSVYAITRLTLKKDEKRYETLLKLGKKQTINLFSIIVYSIFKLNFTTFLYIYDPLQLF